MNQFTQAPFDASLLNLQIKPSLDYLRHVQFYGKSVDEVLVPDDNASFYSATSFI